MGAAIARVLTLAKSSTLKRTGTRVQEAVVGYLLVAPVLAMFAVYYIYAIVRSIWLSLTNYQFILPGETEFIGIDNYVRALQDPKVLDGFVNAGRYTVLFYLGAFFLPLVVRMTSGGMVVRMTSGGMVVGMTSGIMSLE